MKIFMQRTYKSINNDNMSLIFQYAIDNRYMFDIEKQ